MEKFIDSSLQSAMNQTESDIEIICVDDCSTDGSVSKVKRYISKDERIKLLESKKNGGQGVARNLAIKEAKGDYILFLDPDDWLDAALCEKCLSVVGTCSVDICFFGVQSYVEKTKKYVRNKNRIKPFLKMGSGSIFSLKNIKEPLIVSLECWWKLYRREFLLNNNVFFDEGRFGEDGIFGIKALVLSDKVSVLDDYLYTYRVRQNSSTSLSHKAFNNYLNSRKDCLDFIEKHKDREFWLRSYLPYYVKTITYWYRRNVKFGFIPMIRDYALLVPIFRYMAKNYNMVELEPYYDKTFFLSVVNSPVLTGVIEALRFAKSKIIGLRRK